MFKPHLKSHLKLKINSKPKSILPRGRVAVDGAERSESSCGAEDLREPIFEILQTAEQHLARLAGVFQQVVLLDGLQHGVQQQKFTWN